MHSISEAKIENFIVKSAIRKQLKRGHSIPDLALCKKANAQETSLNEINTKSLRTGKIKKFQKQAANTERNWMTRKNMEDEASLMNDDKKEVQTCKNNSGQSHSKPVTETSNLKSINEIKEMSEEPKSSIFENKVK